MASDPDNSTLDQTPSAPQTIAARLRNLIVVSVAVVLAVLVVLGIRAQTPAASLESLATTATPLEIALVNGKPSLVEFYANWCTSCQAMAGEMAELRTDYGDQVNFVMLNVDNNKWLPEMLHYRVDGIPHFVYLDDAGETVAVAIGEQPRAILASNLEALTTHAALPYQQASGTVSDVNAPVAGGVTTQKRSDNPRSHGAAASN